MSEVKNYQEVVDIASKHLGTVGGAGYKDTYAPDLLVKIPRTLNREGYGLTGDEFVGVDTWNAYEVSAITTKGQPVAGFLKIVCPSDSEFHVESKSIKLYLNSFNMTQIADNAKDCIKAIESRVKRDLDELLETNTIVSFYASKKEVEDAVTVIERVETNIEGQLYKEEKIAELDKKLLEESGPVNASQFFNLCSNWSWNLNVAEIAHELGTKHDFDSSEHYWDLYGDLFVLFFSNNETQEKQQKEMLKQGRELKTGLIAELADLMA